MSSIERTLGILDNTSDPHGDSVRAREVYRYFQPQSTSSAVTIEAAPEPNPVEDLHSFDHLAIGSNVSSTKISSPDTALTAFAQLVAWRTSCQRSMISLIDAETQYFIAESTRTIDLVDTSRYGKLDELWVGCTQVSKHGRLCERTISLPPREPDGDYRAFIVGDLSQDPRFNELPFVTGPPFLKFYAGIPLITKRGIPIGSLFVVDDRIRHHGLNAEELRFMGTMGDTIMRHLETTREVEEHRRGMKMSRGLASFVEGRSQLEEDELDVDNEDDDDLLAKPNNVPAQTHSRSKASSKHSRKKVSISSSTSNSASERKPHYDFGHRQEHDVQDTARPASNDNVSAHSDVSLDISIDTYTDSTPDTRSSDLPTKSPDALSEASSMEIVFSRASNLIREAFEIDGGSVFFDAQQSLGRNLPSDVIVEEHPSSGGEGSASDMHEFTKFARTNTADGSSIFNRATLSSRKPVEILGFSTPDAASIHGDRMPPTSTFTAIGERSLQSLLKRYPKGKLFVFDNGEPTISSSEDDSSRQAQASLKNVDSRGHTQRKARAVAEAKILLQHFPGARQLLFAPLWDASRNKWKAGNFTWTKDPTRILSKQGELAFLTGFGNSVMAECSRLDTQMADEKKTAFIGSISHELRSPLHGIMASAEFLGEEVSDGFSKGLVETISSCGRTLLDTINHILDYSKVNNLEKNWRKSRRRYSHSSRQVMTDSPGGLSVVKQADLPMINLFAGVNVAVICEEVIEGVFAGHAFQNITAPSFDMVAKTHSKMSDNKQLEGPDILDSLAQPKHAEVAVIFDVDMADYNLITQPGAFKRVVMNLLGNALKYTSSGYVKVKLEAKEMEPFKTQGSGESLSRSCVTLTVVDTGRGIASEFLRSKLFTPFAQENSLSAGTGLGLSIVKSIVSLLEGEIQIKSEVGRGTEVKVILPVLKELPTNTTSSDTTAQSAIDCEALVNRLRQRVVGKTAALHGFDVIPGGAPTIDEANQSLKSAITNILVNWYGLRIVELSDDPQIIIANEANNATIAKLAVSISDATKDPIVLSLCSQSAHMDRRRDSCSTKARTGYLAKPIGPYKVARALLQCLEGMPVTPLPGLIDQGGKLPTLGEDSIPTWSPEGSELLDNSRMAAASQSTSTLLDSPTPLAPAIETHQEFPFPEIETSRLPRTNSMPSDKQSLSKVIAPSTVIDPLPTRASVVLTKMEKPKVSVDSNPDVTTTTGLPRLLLVDDNKINLRLLRTYMNKRRYKDVDEAENGLEAVQAAEARPDSYDIIFMDISMPVLDGFGATREIRKMEARRRQQRQDSGEEPDPPALIIALTGLASSKDQSEAFTSGIDLFLTKPVSFKEVGKLLENWQTNKAQSAKDDNKFDQR